MPTEAGKTTRFKLVSVTVEGPIPFEIDGYDDGASVTFTPQGDRNTVRPSNDGKDTFAESSSSHWIATLSLLESSEANDKLSQWLASGFTQGLTFLDGGSTDKIAAPKARIRQYSPITKSSGVETRSWDIHLLAVEPVVGSTNQ
jgi:hypothetical protein